MIQGENVNPQNMLPIGATLQGGKYRVDKYLSSGGFGNTYIVTNTKFNEVFAMKEFFMKDICERNGHNTVSVSNSGNYNSFIQQKEKFNKEAQRIRKFNNPHIVKVHDLFDENNTSYYIMDYIDGASLADKMKQSGRPFSEQDVLTFLPQILDGLEEVHKQNIWHLDLHPKNIMLDNRGNVVLIDFGASKQLNPDSSSTTSSAFCYHQGYAPTEQLEQSLSKIGAWTDIYSLGATLYNLLTNLPPLSTSEIQDSEVFAYPQPVCTEMQDLIKKMMQPNRKERLQSVVEVNSFLNRKTEVPKCNVYSKNEDETIYTERNSKGYAGIHLLPSLRIVAFELLSFLGLYILNLNYLHESIWVIIIINVICLLKYIPEFLLSSRIIKTNKLIEDSEAGAKVILVIQGTICYLTVICIIVSVILWLTELTDKDSRSLWEIITNWA